MLQRRGTPPVAYLRESAVVAKVEFAGSLGEQIEESPLSRLVAAGREMRERRFPRSGFVFGQAAIA
jgi:hypothetical protein